MNELKIFEKSEFGKVRVVLSEIGEPMFCLADICAALDIKNVSDCKTRLKKDGVVSKEVIDSMGRKQNANFITESNLYKCIFQSRRPDAELFQDWVCDEVLPSIRKNGGYLANQEQMTPEQIVANALIVANNIISNQNKQLEEMKPKAEFFDTVTDSKDAIDMASAAKVLNMGIGRNRLFEILRQHKFLDGKNQPFQKHIDNGLFRVVESKYNKPNGDICINLKTIVYQKGLEAIRKLLKSLNNY